MNWVQWVDSVEDDRVKAFLFLVMALRAGPPLAIDHAIRVLSRVRDHGDAFWPSVNAEHGR
jgi:hypothetical protein